MTDEELWYFKTNGFYRVRECLPEALVERLNAATHVQIRETREPLEWERTGSRRPEDVRRVSKILDRDPIYLEAATHPVVLDTLEGILGPNIELLTNKHNHIMVRPPDSAVVEWHAGEEPYDRTLITALIYLEESTTENGCIRIVPGSHNRPFRNPRRPREEFRESAHYFRSLPVPMPRGGVLLFDDCCFHGSDVNRGGGSRRSMTLAYQAHDTHDVIKDDPEKILVRGDRVYIGHPSPVERRG